MRYVAGTKQEFIDDNGNQFYHGINQYAPHAEGRTPSSAARNAEKMGALRPHVWDRDDGRFLPADDCAPKERNPRYA